MHITVDGIRLFMRRVGAGPPVVVLHGGPGAHHDYLLPQYDALARGRELIYYDQRGGGRSPVERPTAVGWREHVADLDAVRAHLGLDRLTVLGYSWGGLLALLYYAEHPRQVERLALVAPAGVAREYREQFDREFAARMAAPEIEAARTELRTSGLRERDPEAYRKRAFELSVAGYFRDWRDAQQLTPFRVTGRTQQEVWQSLADTDVRARLASSPIPHPPSLVVHGSFDPIPIASSRGVATLLGAELVELPVGHCPHVEATADFVPALDRFLPRTEA